MEQSEPMTANGNIIPTRLPAVLSLKDVNSVSPDTVRTSQDRIEWTISNQGWVPGASASDCLWNFIKLADAEGESDFVEYAARHGVLGLTSDATPGVASGSHTQVVDGDPTWHWEPIEAWRAWAIAAKSAVLLASALKTADTLIEPRKVLEGGGIQVRRIDDTLSIPQQMPYVTEYPDRSTGLTNYAEMVLFELDPFQLVHKLELHGLELFHEPRPVPTLELQRSRLAGWLGQIWLKYAAISPMVDWFDGPPRLTLGLSDMGSPRMYQSSWPTNSLFSVLAASIVGVVCSDDHVGQCDRCGSLYPSERKVRTGQPNYCMVCRAAVRRATNRTSAMKRRAKERESRGA
jgi:hypothetical protein